MGFEPTYSHGGTVANGRNPVSGAVTGPGRTIRFGDSAVGKACLTIILTGGGGGLAVVKVEVNGGALDTTGEPPASEWADVSGGGFPMATGTILKKGIPVSEPYVRTNIVTISAGCSVSSYVSLVRDNKGQAYTAGAPELTSTQSEF